MITSVCERWRAGRASWRPAGELFDPRAFEVAPTTAAREVRAFVKAHHYARSCGSTVRLFALHARGGALAGVAVFSSPQADAVLRPWPRGAALELGRLVLLDAVPGNAESWFVRRALDLLAGEGWAGVVSFSDPEPRVAEGGAVLFPGHIGTVYQALNAVYTGRGSRKTQYLLADGREFPNRAQSKIRKGERGVRYAVKALVEAGAREPLPGEDLAAWMREERERLTTSRAHQGNHRYAWALTAGAARDLCRDTPRPLPFPKFNLRACADVGGGATCPPAAPAKRRALTTPRARRRAQPLETTT